MTPEERAVVQAAIDAYRGENTGDAAFGRIMDAVGKLILTCPQCNTERHLCPGDGEWIGHGDTSCGKHSADSLPGESEPPGPEPEPEWVPATFADCLAGDHIRIGTEETDVIRASRGVWHADARDQWRPKAWSHIEVRLELAAVGGFPVYPAGQPIEILMSPERRAVHTWAQAFPGSEVVR